MAGVTHRDDEDRPTQVSRSTTLESPPWSGPVRLVVLNGPGRGQVFAIDAADLVIGRGSDADVKVDGPQISRRHARIRRGPSGVFVVEDLGSRNGTFVDGQACSRPVAIDFGQRIQLGKELLLLFTHPHPWEEQLQELRKMEAMGRLASGITHELNNQLAVIQSAIDYLGVIPQTRTLGEPDVQECLEDVRAAISRASDLGRRVLGFARREAASTGALHVSEVVSEVLRMFERTLPRNVLLDVQIGQDATTVIGDGGLLRQALLNLLINARDAMPKGGTIQVRLGVEPWQRLGGPVEVAVPHVVLEVRDSGPGMDDETRRRAFEPFFSTKKGAGTGLGLSMVHEAAIACRGLARIQSAPGQGTTVRLLLPVHEAKAPRVMPTLEQEVAESGERHATARRPLRVLLVDDEDAVRRGVGRVLLAAGHLVTAAPDGETAVKVYQESQPRPEVIILDLDMPGIGGEAAYEMLVAIDPAVSVVILSASPPEGAPARLVRAGARFVPKPATAEAILAMLDLAAGPTRVD